MRTIFFRSLQALAALSTVVLLTGANDAGCGLSSSGGSTVTAGEGGGTAGTGGGTTTAGTCPDGTAPQWVCAGAEGATVSETTAVDGDFRVYRRTAPRAKGGVFVTTWTFAADGAVAGFTITPAAQPAPTAFLDYVTHARLRLPFDGSWYVSWGGRTLADNDHVIARDQRFAYDFVVRNSKSTHRGDGARNEDYFAWDRPIVAPAAGIVVRAVDGVDDNRPAAMNPRQPFGNHVVIDLGNGEFAMLAHLRRGSVAVRAGTRVAAGRVIGRCGNSGNSSEPHLHFHVQNAAREGDVDGLPAQFIHYAADGVDIARGEPVRGQTVRSRWVQP